MALPHHPPAPQALNPTALAVRSALILLLSASCVAAVVTQDVQAAEPAAATGQRSYNIVAGPLGTALSAFAIEAGISISAPSAQVNGLSSAGLRGVHGVDEGLQKLLEGSGLEAVNQGGGAYGLRKVAVETNMTTLGAVTVSAVADSGTEGTGSYTSPVMSTATGLSLSQRQTPQSVSVISRQQMDDFNLTTLQEVALATPGIYAKSQAVSDQETTYFSRGFALTHVNVDGLPLDVTGFNERNVSADMVMYDRVEVVRGATGLMEGAGTPSGSINMVRKRPTATPLLNFSASLGSWQDKQLTVDGSRALNETGTLRGRVAASWRDSDSSVDVVNNKNGTLYGIVEADLAPSTTLGVGFSVQRSRTNGVSVGLPTFADGRHMDLPRSTFLNNADSFQDRDNDVLFADLEHRFDGGWRAKFAVTHIDASSDTRNTTNSRIDGQEYLLSQTETGWHYSTGQVVADLRLSGPVTWFGRQHEVIIGASYRNDDSDASEAWEGDAARVIDIRNWNPRAYTMSGHVAPLYAWGRKTKEKGLYAAGNFNLADAVHLVLGGRFGWYTQDATGWYTSTPKWSRGLHESGEFTPYAGLVYDLDKQHSVYASATEIFQAQSSVDFRGNTLPPLTGTNYEVGVKGEYFGGALNASAAVFRIEQSNRAMRDEVNCPTGGRIACSRAAGEVESEGIDVQISGSPLPGWQIAGGYTYALAKYTRDSIASNIGKRTATDEPRHLFKLYTNYQLPGAMAQWSVGASMYAQDGISRSETGYHAYQGSYATYGLTAGYRVNDKLQVRVNVDNVFDRRYYQALGYSWSGGLDRYGAPRSLAVSLNYKM